MLERIAAGLWSPWLLSLFLAVGLWCSAGTGFFPIFGGKIWLKSTVGSFFRPKKRKQTGRLTQMQALSTAMASTIGTGSIAGVATAIFFGGPGAVFWMWVSAFLGLMTSFVEKSMAVKYRKRASDGGWEGGPMEYLRALHWRGWAAWFSFWCVLASLTGGAMVQANSIAAALHAAFGWSEVLLGGGIAVAAGAVIFGGISRVGRVSERLVPVMAGLFLVCGGLVIAAHAEAIPYALKQIVTCAVSPRAAAGGASGYSVAAALRYGIARGVFTNEAGVGSSAMAHAAADTDSPTEEGFWGMFEVFFATLVVCTVTSLVILTSGVYDPAAALTAIRTGRVRAAMTGAPLAGSAFAAVFGVGGIWIVAFCLLLFAFTSLLGWSYYGERGLASLTGTVRWRRPFQVLFLAAIVCGSVGEVTSVWALSDICNGLMAVPNLLAVAVLLPDAKRMLHEKTNL